MTQRKDRIDLPKVETYQELTLGHINFIHHMIRLLKGAVAEGYPAAQAVLDDRHPGEHREAPRPTQRLRIAGLKAAAGGLICASERRWTMPRVYRVKAAKDYPQHGIKRGETYYWWKFMRGPRCVSRTYPKPSQLTRSAFRSEFLRIAESLEAATCWGDVDDAVSELESLRDETQDKLDNMPDGLRDGDTGQLLQARVDAVQEWLDGIEGIGRDSDGDEAGADESEATEAERAEAEGDEEGTWNDATRERVTGEIESCRPEVD